MNRKKVHQIVTAIVIALLVLSCVFYQKAFLLITSPIAQLFTWAFLIVGIVGFFYRNTIKEYLHKHVFSDPDYLKEYDKKLDLLTDEQRAKDKGPERPLRVLIFALTLYPVINLAFFIGEAVINRLGYNVITSPLATACILMQFYCSYMMIKAIVTAFQHYTRFKNAED